MSFFLLIISLFFVFFWLFYVILLLLTFTKTMLLLLSFYLIIFFHENYFYFFMSRDVPGCSGMFHVPGFIDAQAQAYIFGKASLIYPYICSIPCFSFRVDSIF